MKYFECVVHLTTERLKTVTVKAKDRKSANKKARKKFKRGYVQSCRAREVAAPL